MIKIVIGVNSVEEAVEIRDRLRSTILRFEDGDRATVGWGGVIVHTKEPLRVVPDLVKYGFITNQSAENS